MPRNNPTSEERIRFLRERTAELVLFLNARLASFPNGLDSHQLNDAFEYHKRRLTEELEFAEWLLVQDPVT